MTEFPCMSADELALWQRNGSRRPCSDCPAWFAEAAGTRCIRTRTSRPIPKRGPIGYTSEEYRREARRRTWRESKRRARAA